MNSRLSAVLFGSAAAGVALLALLDAAAKGFVLLALAGVVAFAMRRAPASARHLVWLTALSCALVLPVCSCLLPGWRVLPAWMRWETVHAAVVRVQDGTDAVDGIEVAALKTPAVSNVARSRPSGPSTQFVASDSKSTPRNFRVSALVLLSTWATGAALLFGPLAWSVFSLARVSRRAGVVREGRIAAHVAGIADELSLRRRIRVLLGEDDAMPMVWGIFRAHLLLPASAADWPEARLRGVLLHELAHLRRRDPLALLVAQLALALHWFNPLAWFAVRRLRAEQERACDDFVLRHGIRPSEYANDLLAVATGLRTQPFAAAALTMAHPARIEGRIVGILDAARNRRTLTRWLIAATVLLATAIALPLAMLRAADEKKAAVEDGKPHIVSASIKGQQLRIEVSAGIVPLTFRVGDGLTAARFAHRVSEGAPRQFSVALSPDPGTVWERLEIRYAGRAPHRLPVLPRGFLPDGEWAWRPMVTRDDPQAIHPESYYTKENSLFLPEAKKLAPPLFAIAINTKLQRKTGTARFTFADVLLADGQRLPVSVEVGEVKDAGEVPFAGVFGFIECEFRFYGIKVSAPKEHARMKLNAAEKLLKGAAVVETSPRVTTRSGQRAIIEIIREFRHEVKPGEWKTDNMGVTCEIEPEPLERRVRAQGKVSLALFDGVYASLGEAISKVGLENGKPFAPPASAKVRRLESEFTAALAEDEALVVPLASDGLFPGSAVALVTMKRINGERSHWRAASERAKARVAIESWLVTVPASAQAAMESVFPFLKAGETAGLGLWDEEKFQGLKAAAGKNPAVKIEELASVVAQSEMAAVLEREDFRMEIKAHTDPANTTVDLELIAPMPGRAGTENISTFVSVQPGSLVIFPQTKSDEESARRVLLIRPKVSVAPPRIRR